MKYLRTYEELGKPEIEDYVICRPLDDRDPDLNDFLKTHIGQLVGRRYFDYDIKFEKVPKYIIDCYDNPIQFEREEIIHWSKNKEDLQIYIDINKYNL
jgi:hypothetical protein